MEDPMMSSVLLSVADELGNIGVFDDLQDQGLSESHCVKQSPGHESVDSGFCGPMASPAYSDDTSYDELTDIIYNSLGDIDQAAPANLIDIDFLMQQEDGTSESVSSEQQVGVALMDLDQVDIEIEKNEPIQAFVESPPPVVESKRPVRATRSGKTVVLASGIAQPAIPTTRQRITRATTQKAHATASTCTTADTSTSAPTRTSTKRRSRLPAVVEEAVDDDDIPENLNKNALQARLNRQKKKAYIEGLELQNADLSKENDQLRRERKKADKDIASLKEEVAYLRNVLQNESALSSMLQNIQNVQGLRFTTSFEASRKRTASELDHDYGVAPPASSSSSHSASKKRKTTPPTTPSVSGGVCLHVDNGNVSLEFCAKCSKMYTGGPREDA